MTTTKRAKKPPVPKPDTQKMSENLRKIYENPDGSMPDMSNFERANGARLWRWLTRIFVLLGLVIFGWVAWRFASPRFAYADSVSLLIEGPATIASGDTVTYTVRYRNPDTTPVANAHLSFQYPHGFVLVSSTPAVLGERATTPLGSIAGRSSGVVIITGRMLVDQFTTSTLTAVLSYTPSNFNSIFEKVVRVETVASLPAATIIWNGSTMAVANLPSTLSFVVRPMKLSDSPVIVTVESDQSFAGQGNEPKSDEPDIFRWTLPKLSGPTTFTMHGVFSGANPNPRFVAKVLGKSFLYSQSETNVTLTSSTVRAVASVSGNTDQTRVRPGQSLPIQLSFQNTSDKVYPNLSAVLYVEAPSYQRKSILDWQNLVDDTNGTVKGEQINELIRRGIITWEMGKNKTFAISLPVKDGAVASLVNFGSGTVIVWGEIRSDGAVVATSNKVNVTILSDLALSASTESDGTTNNFSFLLTNSFHDLKNVVVKTTLNGNIAWDQNKLNTPAGSVVFSSGVNEVVWSIKDMPTNLDSLNLEFGVTVTKPNPTQTHYTGPIVVSGTDVETGETISFTVDPIQVE